VLRLWPQGAILALLLAAASVAFGRDAREPGRVVTELLNEGRTACAAARAPTSYVVPFSGTTWLCRPDAPPRLVGQAPGALSGVFFSARAAHLADDLRRVELDDANLALGDPGASRTAILHVDALVMRGLPPWAQAATLPPWLRALLLALAGAVAAGVAAHAALVRRFAPRGRIHAIVVGVAGPLAALGALRVLERTEAHPSAYVVVPLAGAIAVLAARAVANRLLGGERAATK
jgi:hypothetical protein